LAIGGKIIGTAMRALFVGAAAALALVSGPALPNSRFEGVASCAGSTCHGRIEGDGAVVRQDELRRWQDPSSKAGAHSRALSVIAGARGRQIAATLGLGDPTAAPSCIGCHATPGAATRGVRFQQSDGVSCESCHGAAGGWIASHYAVGGTHAANVARGMTALDRPVARAAVCLDCHLGSGKPGQFVSHRMMAAGHPRIAFELDLFSALQQHHDEDADYGARKARSDSVRLWAVGQAMAVNRALTLYATSRGADGTFPELTFFDCHSCHRRIYDRAERSLTHEINPDRPIPLGMPPFNDENMILLAAAVRVGAPRMAAQLERDSRGFHVALTTDRAAAVRAAEKLAATAEALADALSAGAGGTDMGFAIVDSIAGPASAPRFTDYEGSVQAVMAIDTLLNALVKGGRITIGAAAGIRASVNRAYAAVRDPNEYRSTAFRSALGEAARSIRALR
jgi:hypothetical protein